MVDSFWYKRAVQSKISILNVLYVRAWRAMSRDISKAWQRMKDVRRVNFFPCFILWSDHRAYCIFKNLFFIRPRKNVYSFRCLGNICDKWLGFETWTWRIPFFFFLAFIFALRCEVYNLHEYVKKKKRIMYLIAIAPSHAFFHFLYVIDTLWW